MRDLDGHRCFLLHLPTVPDIGLTLYEPPVHLSLSLSLYLISFSASWPHDPSLSLALHLQTPFEVHRVAGKYTL